MIRRTKEKKMMKAKVRKKWKVILSMTALKEWSNRSRRKTKKMTHKWNKIKTMKKIKSMPRKRTKWWTEKEMKRTV